MQGVKRGVKDIVIIGPGHNVHLSKLRCEWVRIVGCILDILGTTEVGTEKASSGTTLAESGFISDQGLSQAVVRACGHVDNSSRWPANHVGIRNTPVLVR